MRTNASINKQGSLRVIIRLGILLLLTSGMLVSTAEAAKKKRFTSYYRDATVFRDSIRNGVFDSGEPSVTTEADGSFTPPKGKGRMYLEGGSHIVTGQENTRRFTAPGQARGIGILTSLWQALVEKNRNGNQIKRALGVPKKASVADFSAGPVNVTKPQKKVALVKANAHYDTLSQFMHSLLGAKGREGVVAREGALHARSLTVDETDDALVQGMIGFGKKKINVADLPDVQTLVGKTSQSLGIVLTEQILDAVSKAACSINQQIDRAPDKLDKLLTVAANATALVELRDFNTLQTQYTGDGLQQQVAGTVFIPIPTVSLLQTSDSTPTLGGTWSGLSGLTENSVNGQTLTIEVNGKHYTTGNGVVSFSGTNWSMTIPPGDALAPGTYDVILTVADSAGHFSNDTTRNELVIQRATTPTPTPTPIPLPPPAITAMTEDTGASATDGITSDTTPTLTGMASPGSAQVNVYRDGILVGNAPVTVGRWSFTSTILSDRATAYSFTARAVDSQGLVGAASTPKAVTVDTTSPAPPTVDPLTTVNPTPTVSGSFSGAAGETVQIQITYFVPGDLFSVWDEGPASINGTTWTFAVTAAMPLNTYDVSVTVADLAGNRSLDTTNNELLIVGTLTPTPPSISNVSQTLVQLNAPPPSCNNNGSLFSMSFDYTDPNGNGPTTLAAAALSASYVFTPSGTTGTFTPGGGSVSGNGFSGTISTLFVCTRFGTDTSSTNTVTIQDQSGLRSAGASVTIAKPAGAN